MVHAPIRLVPAGHLPVAPALPKVTRAATALIDSHIRATEGNHNFMTVPHLWEAAHSDLA
jgi:hypothetical protein